ncbi:ABC transporter substrate-binding protein [Streptomonospora sp. S1-112]|uniref:ABC transporter substrate-binding protein n=1 Tax=Streptomonospora mangrovi TaxID=2883123 RepID=A0A9X3NJ69_9ACTN|nr:ABC transporter substrate-binding protein [Streptomonospora mangrovi]MDA0563133.1 ABC transporter substrate-binding protein [Streptomonospora mangrovi]
MHAPTPGRRPPGRAWRAPCAAALVLALTLTGCDFFSLDPEEEAGSGGEANGQAPALAERVEAGDLPPLEERLPDNPLVVEPVEEVGVYGGTWRSAVLGIGDWPWLGRTVGYENLTRWNTEWTEVVPNLAEEFEYNEDATELTFRLREGLRWSDGEPFTADDIVFAVNDVFNNEDLTPVAAQNPPTAEKVDDTTVVLTFPEPDALWAGHDLLQYQLVNKPRHYLEEFHIDHNPDADQLAEEQGYADWVELFEVKAGVTDSALTWQNPDIPTMNAWQVTEPLADSGRVVLERNPYYWKVDTEGNQLPYIDRVVFDIMQDDEVMLTRALNGDINFHTRHFNTLENRPVLAENRESGGYRFVDLQPGEMNTGVISFNLTHQDAELREVFRDRDFRVAMSLGIDRQSIIDVVYQGQGEPWQAAPRRDTPFFNEELAKQYTEYDVERANALLDEAGYDERNGDGVRVAPGGRALSFTLSVPGDFRPDIVDSMEMVVGFWEELDVDVEMEIEERSLWQDRRENNEHDANVWSGDSGLLDAMYDPRWYAPVHSGESNFAIPWAQWYVSDGNDPRAQEPPREVREHLEIYDELLAEPDPQAREEKMRELLEVSQERFYAIGINLTPPGYGIVAEDFRNVPETMPEAAVYNTPGPTNPEQYFIRQ